MMDDNLTRQADEIEALASIYGDELCIIDEASRAYSIDITDYNLSLRITLPTDYPSDAPPSYQLNAPWLQEDDRQHIQNLLEQLYLENIGESIIYLWVEKLREFLIENEHQQETAGGTSSAVSDTLDEQENDQERDKMTAANDDVYEGPEIFHGGPVTDRKSTFQGHLAKVTSKREVDMVMAELLSNKKIASATHNILSYRIVNNDKNRVLLTGCEDDGEHHAGSRLLHLMQLMNAENVMVVITRWYGGIHLGPDRFKYINNSARLLLETHGFRQESNTKQGPRSGGKKK